MNILQLKEKILTVDVTNAKELGIPLFILYFCNFIFIYIFIELTIFIVFISLSIYKRIKKKHIRNFFESYSQCIK